MYAIKQIKYVNWNLIKTLILDMSQQRIPQASNYGVTDSCLGDKPSAPAMKTGQFTFSYSQTKEAQGIDFYRIQDFDNTISCTC